MFQGNFAGKITGRNERSEFKHEEITNIESITLCFVELRL